jgi:hypothetical protein
MIYILFVDNMAIRSSECADGVVGGGHPQVLDLAVVGTALLDEHCVVALEDPE